MKNTLIFIVAIVLAGSSGYALQNYLASNSSPVSASSAINNSAIIGQPRPEFAIADINGDIRNIREWDGRVVLVNFWATWCPPCLKEIPAFIEVQEQVGEENFQIIGIAVDNEELVVEFAREMDMNYPVMAAETEGIELAQRYGNSIGGLPYSAIIDRNGTITHTVTGELSKERLEGILGQLGVNI